MLFNKFYTMYFREANRDGGNDSGNDDNNNSDEGSNAPTFDDWFTTQPDDVKTLINARMTTLHNTVKAVRDERDDFHSQLQNAVKKLKDDTVEKQEFERLMVQYEETKRKQTFLEEAISNQCTNPKAAYAVASADDLFDKKGNPDWAKIKQAAPEFFTQKRRPLPRRNTAGEGNDTEQPSHEGMNSWIRREAGRGVTT